MNSELSSFSTEPEETTLSLSEFDTIAEGIVGQFEKKGDPDSESVISDLQSRGSNKNFRIKDGKRNVLATLSVLKNENLMLKAALEKANITDMSTLQGKLRVAQNDLILYKQYNSELKDRVQELEGKLFQELNRENEINKKGILIVDKTKDQKIKALESKNSHLVRLTKSYEKSIRELQVIF